MGRELACLPKRPLEPQLRYVNPQQTEPTMELDDRSMKGSGLKAVASACRSPFDVRSNTKIGNKIASCPRELVYGFRYIHCIRPLHTNARRRKTARHGVTRRPHRRTKPKLRRDLAACGLLLGPIGVKLTSSDTLVTNMWSLVGLLWLFLPCEENRLPILVCPRWAHTISNHSLHESNTRRF